MPPVGPRSGFLPYSWRATGAGSPRAGRRRVRARARPRAARSGMHRLAREEAPADVKTGHHEGRGERDADRPVLEAERGLPRHVLPLPAVELVRGRVRAAGSGRRRPGSARCGGAPRPPSCGRRPSRSRSRRRTGCRSRAGAASRRSRSTIEHERRHQRASSQIVAHVPRRRVVVGREQAVLAALPLDLSGFSSASVDGHERREEERDRDERGDRERAARLRGQPAASCHLLRLEHAREELARARLARVAEDLLRRALLEDAAAVEEAHLVGAPRARSPSRASR